MPGTRYTYETLLGGMAPTSADGNAGWRVFSNTITFSAPGRVVGISYLQGIIADSLAELLYIVDIHHECLAVTKAHPNPAPAVPTWRNSYFRPMLKVTAGEVLTVCWLTSGRGEYVGGLVLSAGFSNGKHMSIAQLGSSNGACLSSLWGSKNAAGNVFGIDMLFLSDDALR